MVTARSVYLFAPFSKQCTRCPIEKVCWTPEIVADPIPMSSIEYIVDMEGVPMLALAMKTRSGLFSFGGFRKQILVVQARDYLAKNEIVNSLGLSTTLNVAPDPVFSEFFANRIEDFQGAQMVGASSDSPQPRKSALADEEIRSPHMMVVTREKLRFFRVGFGAWKFLDAPVDGSTPAEEEETKDGPVVTASVISCGVGEEEKSEGDHGGDDEGCVCGGHRTGAAGCGCECDKGEG